MILDERSTERSALHALELLDADERESFERDARINPDLAACTAEFRDIGADIAVASCPKLEPPPLTALTGALERIGAAGTPKTKRPVISFQGWQRTLAACAAVALLIGGGVTVLTRIVGGGDDGKEQPAHAIAKHKGENDKVVILRNGETVATLNATELEIREVLKKLNRLDRLRPAPDIIQDVARLKRELESLRKADAERFSAGPRVARTVYIEMVEPGTEAEESDLTERMAEYIASAIEIEVGASEAGNSVPVDGKPDEGGETPVIIDPDGSNVLPDLNGVGDDTDIFYRGFPADNDRFEKIDDGRVWDGDNERIWVETDEPGVYKAIVPPEHFDSDFIEDFPDLPVGGSIPGPPSEIDAAPEPVEIGETTPAALEAEADVPAEGAEKVPPPVAVTIYEETTGRGSVVIGNLPPAGDRQAYQLWMRNAADDQVVSVGMLPPLEDGSERFEFDLLGPGITPAGFFLTLEPEGGVDSPGETVILQGP